MSGTWYRLRKERALTKNSTHSNKKKKVKKWLNKIADLAREAFDIYVMLKRKKDPIGIALGVVSTYNTISDMFEKEPPSASERLKAMGVKKVFSSMCTFIFNTLKQMDFVGKRIWEGEDDEDDASRVEEFDIGNGVKVWFTLSGDSSDRDPSSGPYVVDKEAFSKQLSVTVEEKLGSMLSIGVFTKGWDEFHYLDSLNIPTDLYVSQIDEEDLYYRISELQKKGFNRSILFYGPPGVGKTTLAARMSKRFGGRLFLAPASMLENSSVRRLINDLVNIVNPSVMLMDDLDKMWRPEDMLGEMEKLNRDSGLNKRLIIATVNLLSDIPTPMRRPGRFDEIVEFGFPNIEQRGNILKLYIDNFGVEISDKQLELLKKVTGGMTGAFLREVVLKCLVVPCDKVIETEVPQMKELCGLEDEEDDDEEEGDDSKEACALDSDVSSEDVKSILKVLRSAVTSSDDSGWRRAGRKSRRTKPETSNKS
jgi:DNA polymerase III delta prime subunit